ncbi:D-aminoacyl-tRNA deacylase, partial [Desulfobacterota bacterium AH_259_B03_O07]|nr:D-aminoacyl-tRNA deacylase [Desulfobacterota bacterium AH_259_B03_O07]
YELFIDSIKKKGINVATGIFGAIMDVQLTNSGPVTILLDSKKIF